MCPSLYLLYSHLKPNFPLFSCPLSLYVVSCACFLTLKAWRLCSPPPSEQGSSTKETNVRTTCKVNCPASKPWTHSWEVGLASLRQLSHCFPKQHQDFQDSLCQEQMNSWELILSQDPVEYFGAAGTGLLARTGVIYLECHWTCFLKGKGRLLLLWGHVLQLFNGIHSVKARTVCLMSFAPWGKGLCHRTYLASYAVDFPLSVGNDMEGILWIDNSTRVKVYIVFQWAKVDFSRITWYCRCQTQSSHNTTRSVVSLLDN